MPSQRLGPRPRHRYARDVRTGVDAILTEDVLPEERFDLGLARRVLDYVLRKPAEEIKAQTVARAVGIDARTVNRYVDVLERRFLIQELNNLHRSAKTTARVTAKAYPADTSLAAEWLPGASYEQLSDGARGHLFEAFVVQQLRAHLGWSVHGQGMYHWRDTRSGRTHEVDVVLESADGSLVGIEVKASAKATDRHFTGLRHMQAKYGDRFARGFVVTAGGKPTAFGKELWALPVDALRDPDLWEGQDERLHTLELSVGPEDIRGEKSTENRSGGDHRTQERTALQSLRKDASVAVMDTRIFVSYAHRDLEGAHNESLVQFARDVVTALDTVHEWTAELKVDEDFLHWGDGVDERIESELAESALFLPFITPSYLKSDWCRREFTQFAEAAERMNGASLILPLIWIKPRTLREGITSDPLIDRVSSLKWLDANAARVSDRGSQEYRQTVNAAAEQLATVLEERAASPDLVQEETTTHDDRDLTEVLASVEDLEGRFKDDVARFGQAFETFGAEFQQLSVKQGSPGRGGAKEMLNWAEAARHRLEEPSKELEGAANALKDDWLGLTKDLTALIGIGESTGQEIPAEQIEDLARDLEVATAGLQDTELAQMENIAEALPHMSRRLAPVAKALRASSDTIKTLTTSSDSWLDSMHRAARPK